MAEKNFVETLTQYRLKVEKDGKSVVDVPSILALPGMLIAPKLSLTGLVAAPLLGMKVRLENEEGKEVNVGGAVRDAMETVGETVTTAAKSIREEIDKAWQAMSADDPEETGEESSDAAGEEPLEEHSEEHSDEAGEAAKESLQDIVEELEKREEEEKIPTIQVKPEDSAKA